MKKALTILCALALTLTLAWLLPRAQPRETEREKGVFILRVWVAPGAEGANAWLRRQAAAYEKQGGGRVYLRSAASQELQAVDAGDTSAVAPDLIISPEGSLPLAYLGYALILPQTGLPAQTPAPTSMLFSPPSPVPGPAATPAPPPALSSLAPIAAPEALSARVEGAAAFIDPAGALAKGLVSAALLTPAQAGALPFGYRAFGLESAFLPIGARALTPPGEGFAAFLQSDEAQLALRDAGLFSIRRTLRLYGPQDPLRALMEDAQP